ncbi:hypothetical protein CC117_08345 [Parafrankia colletiae]|uniref:OmpR/PhoB-type domain-containing protein n=1 Tax=Parafrankia colletiae TaxID=573497 RepID=A0A1S1Q6Y5_9ACTN|nr:BTAD domain-containing putative transcriptional regulator [Parafrankia colletiae]MCK9898985.1 hypothetical protein [Frankia sp. Cpl3]OHV29356.1 hypothetical protein CC117_08345 [Parafrankia colletiae]
MTDSTIPDDRTTPRADVEVDLLGPMRLRVDGSEVAVPGARRRALLATLALAQARVVGVGALTEAVWGTEPPTSAGPTLHSHLSRIRGHLGARADHLLRDGGGYRLVLTGNSLDAARAEASAARARALRPTDPAAAADQLRLALGLWRGDALAEFGEGGPLGAEAVRLARLRQTLTDELLDARLGCEPAAVVIGDAVHAAAADPLREAAHLLLIRALALDGRAPEALSTARDFRRRLADETGLAASAALADLERAVARGELVRGAPPPVRAAAAAPPSQPAERGTPGERDPRDPRSPRVRLPRSPTPLLGRADELDRLAELLRADRCVTIVGPGGVGKTRLMLDLVHRAAPLWPDGATLVELAPVRDEATVPFALAQALEVSTRGDLLHTVIDFLSTRRQILVIDNCEHLLDAARALVVELLRWVPHLAVLTTSRAPLGAAGEWVFRLGPLALPAPGTDPADAADAAAVRLFLDRARQARGGTELSRAAVGDAVEICRGLDGLPLAIELAASRLTVLHPTDLRARMDTGLDLGRGGGGPADDHRHQTLRGTIAWSYRLLDARAQRLFRHLAAVPGVFELSVAEFVATAIADDDPVAALGALVDTSMVETVPSPVDPGGGTAFRMLDSIRAYGTEAARAAGELEGAQDLIAAWSCTFSRAAAAGLTGGDAPWWGRRILAALPVLRASRERLLERGDVAAAVRICVDIEEYAIWHDNAELWAWTLDSTELPGVADLPDAAQLLAAASHAAWRSGSLAQAVDLARRSLACAQDEIGVSVARYALGTVALFTGDYDASVENLTACAEVDSYRIPNQLAVAALAAAYGGRGALAEQLITRADRLMAGTAMAVTRAFVPYVQAEIHTHSDPALARRHAERALREARSSAITFIVGITLVTLASSATRTGDLATAAACYPEVIQQWLRTGSWPQQWTTLRNTADLLARLGREEDALLMLIAAEADPDAPAVVGVDAEQLAGLVTRLDAHLGDAVASRIRQDAVRLGRVEVVERALAAVAALRAATPDAADAAGAGAAARI